MATEIEDLLEQYSPKRREEYLDDWAEAIKLILPWLGKAAPEKVAKIFASLSHEQREMLSQLLNQQEKQDKSNGN